MTDLQNFLEEYKDVLPLGDDDLLDKNEVCQMLGGIHPSTLWRMVRAGKWPKPIKINTQIRRWSWYECHRTLEALKAGRV